MGSFAIASICLRRGRDALPAPLTQMVNEVHFTRNGLPLRTILARMRHDSCGWVAKAELLAGIKDVSSRPLRRIVPRAG